MNPIGQLLTLLPAIGPGLTYGVPPVRHVTARHSHVVPDMAACSSAAGEAGGGLSQGPEPPAALGPPLGHQGPRPRRNTALGAVQRAEGRV